MHIRIRIILNVHHTYTYTSADMLYKHYLFHEFIYMINIMRQYETQHSSTLAIATSTSLRSPRTSRGRVHQPPAEQLSVQPNCPQRARQTRGWLKITQTYNQMDGKLLNMANIVGHWMSLVSLVKNTCFESQKTAARCPQSLALPCWWSHSR